MDIFDDETRYVMWRRILLTGSTFVVISISAQVWAFDRAFPPTVKRGTMSPATYPELIIDGKIRRLAPGARVWNARNLIVLPASLREGGVIVNYTENVQRQIDRVWILNPDEARRPLPAPTNSQSQ